MQRPCLTLGHSVLYSESLRHHLVQTLMHHRGAVWILSDLQQDLLHVSIFPRRIDQLCDLLLQGPRQSHKLDKLAIWAFVNLQAQKHKLKDKMNRHTDSRLSASGNTKVTCRFHPVGTSNSWIPTNRGHCYHTEFTHLKSK